MRLRDSKGSVNLLRISCVLLTSLHIRHGASVEKDPPAGTPLPDTHVLSDTLNPLQVSPGYMKYTLRASGQAG